MSKVKIYTLGGLRLEIDGVDIAANFKHSPKKLLLLEYLIVNRSRPATMGTLVDVLWGEKEDLNAENTLKTLVSRLRKDLSDYGLEDAIITKRGAYMWNPDLDCEIDMAKMDDICKKLEDVNELTEESIAMFEDIVYMYNNDLLVDSTLNIWIAPKTYYYHNLYIKSISKYIRLLNEQQRYSEAIRVCKTALEIDAFDSMLNIELMVALLKIGKNKEALAQYKNVTELHYAHLGVKPSQEILDFYKELLINERSAEANIDEIYAELINDDTDDDRGGFVCEYAIFKDIYRLYMSNLRRIDATMFLAMVSIRQMGIGEANPLELDLAMRNLRDLLRDNLRNGDTISRYSSSQYAMLLPNIDNFETGRTVLKRLQQLYYSDINNAKYKFDFKLMKLNSNNRTSQKMNILSDFG